METPEKRHPNVNLAAPVGSLDMAAFDEEGNSYEISACPDCLPWHAEVIVDDDGDIMVREWHAYNCPLFQSLLNDD